MFCFANVQVAANSKLQAQVSTLTQQVEAQGKQVEALGKQVGVLVKEKADRVYSMVDEERFFHCGNAVECEDLHGPRFVHSLQRCRFERHVRF